MEVPKNTVELEKENLGSTSMHDLDSNRSQSPFLDENTSFSTSSLAKNVCWDQFNRESFQLEPREYSYLSQISEKSVSPNMIKSDGLLTSLCASPSQKELTKNCFMLGGRQTCKKDNIDFQKTLNHSETDDSCVGSREKVVSAFRRKKSQTGQSATKSDFQAIFDSSPESLKKSKISHDKFEESIKAILAEKNKTSVFRSRKKSSVKKDSLPDFRSVFDASSTDDSCVGGIREKAVSAFRRKRSQTGQSATKSDFQEIFDSSPESFNKSKKACDVSDVSVVINDLVINEVTQKNGILTENEHQNADAMNEGNIGSNSVDLIDADKNFPELEKNNVSRTCFTNNLLCEKTTKESKEHLHDDSNNIVPEMVCSDEKSISKNMSSHISDVDCEETNHENKTLKELEVSFGTNEINNGCQPVIVINNIVESELPSRISDVSTQQSSLKCPENDSLQISGKFGIEKADSGANFVLALDDSMEISSESDDESINEVNEDNFQSHHEEDRDYRSVSEIKENGDNMNCDNVMDKISGKSSSKLDYTSDKENNKSGSRISNLKPNTFSSVNSVSEDPASKSDSCVRSSRVLRSWSATRTNESNVVITEINENYNSMEITSDSMVDQSSLNATNTNKDKSIFKVPNIDYSLRSRSSRSHLQKSKGSGDTQNVTTELNYLSIGNASVGSVSSENNTSLEKVEPAVASKRVRRSLSKDNTLRNRSNRSKNETPETGSIERTLCIPFSELKRKHEIVHNKVTKDCLLANEILSFKDKPLEQSQRKSKSRGNVNIRLKKPKTWVSDHLYNFIVSKITPKYDFKSRRRAEKFVEYLCNKYDIIMKDNVEFKKHVDELILEMAKLRLIDNLFDFYDFVVTFLPFGFHEKSIPGVSIFGKPPLVPNPPRGTLFSNIL